MKTLTKFLLLIFVLVFLREESYAQYSLDQSLGAPYTESIYGSHDGNRTAWVINEKGKRNIWFTNVDRVEAKQVTMYNHDDGQGISQVKIIGDYIFYVRGSGNNRFGDISNPASIPQTPVRQILRIHLESLKLDTIDAASGLQLSPDGESLIYQKGKAVYLVNSLQEATASSKKLFEVRRSVGQLVWSPDGQRVAFVSSRGDHSFIGVYSISENKITWMDPALNLDANPSWSPDGTQLTFIRGKGLGKDELINIMSGRSFEIMVADISSGKAKSIWNSEGPYGGFSQYYPNTPIKWMESNRILFYSEHEDRNHIYAIDPDGSNLTDLTAGECETENFVSARDGQSILVTTNCGDINRRHIWKVNIVTGASSRITDSDHIQTNPVALNGNALAYREGRYNRPTAAVLNDGSQIHQLVEIPDDYPANDFVVPEAVTFKSADGLTIHGQMFVPKNRARNDRAPSAIFMHGGPIRQMLLGYHYSGYYANSYVMNQYLCSQGYVVLSVNYRNGIGYGRDFRLDKNQGPRGASEYQDIIAAGKFLQSREEVNPEKIGLWGGSYGGYLTAMGLAKNSDMFKAGVDLHGVHDWAWRARDFSPGGSWGIGKEDMDLAYHSSPISELRFWSSPVLIVHGDDDRNVLFGQSIDLKNKLDQLGVHSEILVFPDEVHGFLLYKSWLRTFDASADFFNRFLK